VPDLVRDGSAMMAKGQPAVVPPNWPGQSTGPLANSENRAPLSITLRAARRRVKAVRRDARPFDKQFHLFLAQRFFGGVSPVPPPPARQKKRSGAIYCVLLPQISNHNPSGGAVWPCSQTHWRPGPQPGVGFRTGYLFNLIAIHPPISSHP
jgi:hypothetical protein